MQYILILFGWLIAVGVYQDNKPLPEGLNYRSEKYTVADEDIEFLADLTYKDSLGNIVYEHEIFNSIDSLVCTARQYILIDMFLFNSFKGPRNYTYRELTTQLTERLVNQKSNYMNLKIDFITDPINTIYGGYQAPELKILKDNDINVIVTDMRKTRDNVYLFSPVWRTFIQWFGNNDEKGWLRNPLILGGDKVTLRSYLAFANLKANHRKVLVVDNGNEMVSLITSHNSHSASSDFSNIGLMVKGNIFKDILYSERTIADFSNGYLQDQIEKSKSSMVKNELPYRVTFLTEMQINKELVHSINMLGKGDSLRIAAFYLSKRDVVRSILNASKNGTDVKIILDPNRYGFGYKKYGTPNQPVAYELIKRSDKKIRLHWYLTHGEQFHVKLNYIKYKSGTSKVLLGNSNLTKKNLGGYNLEAEFMVEGNSDTPLMKEIDYYFERLWNNYNGNVYTVDYDDLKDESFSKRFRYRVGEAIGTAVY
jgi:hypothetical protein